MEENCPLHHKGKKYGLWCSFRTETSLKINHIIKYLTKILKTRNSVANYSNLTEGIPLAFRNGLKQRPYVNNVTGCSCIVVAFWVNLIHDTLVLPVIHTNGIGSLGKQIEL